MSENEKEALPPMEVPKEALSPEALKGVIENFILREGTDYGREEIAFETKVRQIEKQLDKGEIKIVFDPNTETVGLATEQQWQRLLKSSSTKVTN